MLGLQEQISAIRDEKPTLCMVRELSGLSVLSFSSLIIVAATLGGTRGDHAVSETARITGCDEWATGEMASMVE